MGYFNMVLQYGQNKFLNDCKKSKVDGLIIVDLPWQKTKNLQITVKKNLFLLFNLFRLLHQK